MNLPHLVLVVPVSERRAPDLVGVVVGHRQVGVAHERGGLVVARFVTPDLQL